MGAPQRRSKCGARTSPRCDSTRARAFAWPASATDYYTQPVEDALILRQHGRSLTSRCNAKAGGRVPAIGAGCIIAPTPEGRRSTMAEAQDLKTPAPRDQRRVPPVGHQAPRARRSPARAQSKHYLSDAEQFEEVTLKKRKLQLKDRMEAYRCGSTAPAQRARCICGTRRLTRVAHVSLSRHAGPPSSRWRLAL